MANKLHECVMELRKNHTNREIGGATDGNRENAVSALRGEGMKELYTRKGQTGSRRRYYAEYGDAISDVPSFERVTLMGPRERGWERFVMRDLPGGVIEITKTP